MGKEVKNYFANVISADPYTHSYYSASSGFLTKTTSPSFSKKQYAISSINTHDIMSSKISISKNIDEEDLYDAISNKAYEDLSLDQALEYKIQYIETFSELDDKNRFFHIFVVNPHRIEELFAPVVEHLKYIDTIIPAPLLIKGLYSKEIIEQNNLDCFIYFQENDTFLTLYSDGEFLFTKSLNYSFIQMHERFCEIYGERIEYSEFLEFLTKENLKHTKSDYKEYFIQLYKEIFTNITSILTYIKRVYEFEKIDHLYVGTYIDTATTLDEMMESELNIKCSQFNFEYGFESDTQYIDQIHSLLHLYVSLDDTQKYNCNFTNFIRPPKFTKRQSGKLLMLLAASVVIAFAYPLSYWVTTYVKTLQYDELAREYKQKHIQKTTKEALLKTKQADYDKLTKLLQKEQQEYQNKKNTLMKIHDVKVNYPMKAKHLYILTKNLNRYHIGLDTITYTEQNNTQVFKLHLLSYDDRDITKLLEHLTNNYNSKFNFTLNKISYDEKNKNYTSELKVVLL